MHHLGMRIRGTALLVMTLTLLFSSTFHASAEPTPSPSPDHKMLMDQYKLDFDQYRTLVQAREKARSQINRNFMLAVEEANRDARTAMKLAKTAAAKNEILSNQKIAITSASVTRDAAIAELGAVPTPPVKPTKAAKPVEMAPLNNMKSKKASPSPTR
jgi:hypothetical protein